MKNKWKKTFIRYINSLNLMVSLPLAFSLSDYRYSPKMGKILHWEITRDPSSFNELFLKPKANHELRVHYKDQTDAKNLNYFTDIIYFTYLIDDVIIHQYVDTITYSDDSIIELTRVVDGKYKFYCWKTGRRIFYQELK